MTAYESIQELRDLYVSLETRIAKLEAALKQKQAPPTQEEIVQAEYGAPSWEPSEKQLKYAADIAALLGHKVNFKHMTRADVSDYITRYKHQYFQRLEDKRRLERDATKMKSLDGGIKA